MQTFFSVTVRQATPAISAGSLLCAIYVIADFGAPSILRVDTFTRAIFTSFSMGFDRLSGIALSSVLLVLTMLVLVVEGRIRRRSTRYAKLGGGASGSPVRLNLGVWEIPALLLAWGTLVISLGVPAGALAYWSYRGSRLRGHWQKSQRFRRITMGCSSGRSRHHGIGAALGALSGSQAIVDGQNAGTLCLPGSLPAGGRHRPVHGHAGHLGLPCLLPDHSPTDSAYCTLMLPLALGPALAAALNSPPELEEAAQALGKSSVDAYLRVTLPVIAPGIGAGALMVMLTVIKELPAT